LTVTASRLGRLAQRSAAEREAVTHRCELCDAAIGAEHRHLLELHGREIVCACRPCSLLFPGGNGLYRVIGDRRLRLDEFAMDDAMWDELRVPVDMAFFFHNSVEERVMAFYPSPMGPTESLLQLDAWADLVAANPVLETLEPDVEALLVHRAHGARRHYLVPIDECYALVGVIRTSWKGFTGGREAWQEIARFYDDLDRRTRHA
jgi:hypothetical protein